MKRFICTFTSDSTPVLNVREKEKLTEEERERERERRRRTELILDVEVDVVRDAPHGHTAVCGGLQTDETERQQQTESE
jgi:hypothetical protein